MRHLLRYRALALPVIAAALAVTVGLVGSAGSRIDAATKWIVFAGGGRAGISVDIFRPSVINVNQGDSIEFQNPYEEIHTVTFLAGQETPEFVVPAPPPVGMQPSGPPKLIFNPKATTPVPASGVANLEGTTYLNSGILGKDQSWTVTFPRTGSFEFICILHPFMKATVNVLSPGIFVSSQETRNAEAAGQLAFGLAAGERAAASVSAARSANPNGTSSWEIRQPPAGPGTVNRFIPARLAVGVGDTVTWKNDVPGPPHTVTFTSGGPVPPFAVPEPQPSGPPVLAFPANVAFPVKPSQNYEGTGYVNSGVMGTAPSDPGGTTFSLTFTRAGTFPYVCILHADQGMTGVIEVGAAGSGGTGGTGIRPPSTGNAGLVMEDSAWWATTAVLGAFAVLLGSGVLAFAFRGRLR
jgi:plastocyanin